MNFPSPCADVSEIIVTSSQLKPIDEQHVWNWQYYVPQNNTPTGLLVR